MESPSIDQESFLKIINLSKEYTEGQNQLTVLSQANLEVSAGQFIALLGRSGSGKSTLLNLIAGIDIPSSGQIQFGGLVLTDLSEKERTLFRRKQIGFVFQTFNLIPTLTVKENLSLPLELNTNQKIKDSDRIHYLLEQLGLLNRIDSFPDRLSGGEQQRVAIARAIIHQPSLILADEPTGNLDAQTSTVVLELLNKLVREAGHTMIIATHNEKVAALADRVVVIQDGQIKELPQQSHHQI